MKLIIVLLQIFLLLPIFSFSIQSNYSYIFSFGDSFTDTGNLVVLYGGLATATPGVWIVKPPYGMTFFGRPNGRASDGRLSIDFIGSQLQFTCSKQASKHMAELCLGDRLTANLMKLHSDDDDAESESDVCS